MSDEPLKILLTDPHLRGGGQVRYLTNLAGELTRLGHKVTIGCRRGSVLEESAREAQCNSCPEFPFRGGLRPRSWAKDLMRIRRFIHEESPDIIHANLSQDHWSCALTNRLLGFPVCVMRTRHNTYPVRETYVNRVLNHSWTEYQIVVCDVVRKTLADQPTFEASRLCSIHNGVDAELFSPNPAQRAKMRAEFGYDDSHLVLGIAARLVRAKGHEFLLKAVAQLHQEFPNLRLLILGQGDLEASLKNLCNTLSIHDIVCFAGFHDDMAACTQAFDVGIQPSIDCDTSSFSLKEQMAEEKPVIASDYGGLGEIVRNDEEGLIVPAGTVEPLADAIRTLAKQADLRREMGRKGRQRVLAEFTLQVFAARTVEAYRTALDLHKQRLTARRN